VTMYANHEYSGIAAWNFKMTDEVHSYEQAQEVFDRLYFAETDDYDEKPSGGTRLAYKIGPNMWISQGDGFYSVVLYDTEIIRYYPGGTFSVDNGGFNTPTTTERLQAVLPNGFRCYHFSTREIKGKLGLTHAGSPWPRRRKVQAPGTLWPLDHTRRITTEGELV